ncbi:MAG TPA: glycoside hydrolase family 30 beta sandwich domain-containing protein [Terriglobales bacterium]|nr:glycoside hydrolase family 30 beta sandwich domain-containing protein [Terriglobales bacterium]
MRASTRRNFLKSSAIATASLAAFNGKFLWAAPAGGVQAWTTSKSKKFEKTAVPQWRATTSNGSAAIQLDPTKRYQKILGFGAAFTDASCYLFSKLNEQERRALLTEFFGPSGLRMSVCRTCIGASDYSTSAYTFDESPDPDPELKKFSIEHDQAYILPTLRAAREINPELFLFSSPWTPPGWMKAGNSMLGGSMRKEYFAPYAEYFVKFLQGYSDGGVKINAVTVQNEVDTDQNGRMPAALWGQEYEIEFVKSHLGPALEKASPDTKIWILDHNYNLWGRAEDELSDPDLNKYVDGVAWHGYFGDVSSMTRVHEAFPAKNAYWTEGGPDYTSPDYLTDWAKWGHTYNEVLRNWARCIVGWNLILDENGKPDIGPFSCGGVVTVNSKTHAFTRSGQYWAFAHYSKMIERGAQVIGSHGELKDISHVAFENPDGRRILVVTNQGGEQEVSCQAGNQALDLTLEPNSITTLIL